MDFSLLDSLQTPIWIYDIQRLQMVWANRAALWLWDAPTLEDLLDRDFSDVSAATQTRLGSYFEGLQRGQTFQASWTFYPQGKPVSVQCFCSGVHLEDGYLAMQVEGHLPGQSQADERQRIEQALRQQAEMLQAMFDHIPIMVALIDPKGKIQFINKALENILGWSLEDWQTKDILAECYPNPEERQQVIDHIQMSNDQWLDTKIRNALGQVIDTAWYNLRLSDGSTISIGQDITERKRWENYLQHLATHDKLTALPNRYQFDEYLAQEWKRQAREQQPLSLILCDIDEFKAYNDALGHIAGDTCLVQVAQTIDSVLKRPADLATRYGGEEFAVILPNTDLTGAVNLAAEIRQAMVALAIPHPNSGVSSNVTLSFGVACVYPSLQLVPQHLTAMADTALYDAKRTGRDRYCVAE
jgi:diguanylate cyclase (GGDEF)-like protein/PAS domain S-box-containing protein